ncbi:TetR/AcrR family transcriptional regulator [Pseudoalteromonas mariniglutinosa]|uniref:TetR/AcrR family transcriptional regulator n=1 Tax=Pseudoalteromonas mariniglutinosa TaxID=206042 RepID=UPI00385160AA
MNKKQQTHDLILKQAWQLFTDKGFENTSTREISQRAGIAVGTLFSHFTTKIVILDECLTTRFDEVIKQAKDTDFHRSARLKLNHYAQYFFHFYCQHASFYRPLFACQLFTAQFQQQQVALMQQLILADQPQFNKVKAAILLDCYFMTLLYGLKDPQPNTKLMLRSLSQKVSLL